jgi:hypothetical protein
MAFKNIHEIKFETEEKHKKGLATEDAALRGAATVAKSLKAEIVQRVIPPFESHVDECDAILLTDSCVMIMEVKRIGGYIRDFSLTKDILSVEQGKGIIKIENPVINLRRRCTNMKSYIGQADEWRKLRFLFHIAGIGDSMPVVPILCFGPSTGYEYEEKDPGIIVCTTRTLQKSLKDYLDGKKSVIGAYRFAKQIVCGWQIAGKLKVRPIAGFVRAIPAKTFGKITAFEDVMSIEGKKNGQIIITYRDKVRKMTKEIKTIVFRVNTNRMWEEVSIDAGRTFTWKAGG